MFTIYLSFISTNKNFLIDNYCLYICYFIGAKRDEDGYLWVTGRIDDMVNVSGHLLSTAEIESALVEHATVAEAAVVSHPHKIKGESTYCFVTLKEVSLCMLCIMLHCIIAFTVVCL